MNIIRQRHVNIKTDVNVFRNKNTLIERIIYRFKYSFYYGE